MTLTPWCKDCNFFWESKRCESWPCARLMMCTNTMQHLCRSGRGDDVTNDTSGRSGNRRCDAPVNKDERLSEAEGQRYFAALEELVS